MSKATHLFNYPSFIADLSTGEKAEVHSNYQEKVEPLGQKPIQQEVWFKQLVAPFATTDNFLLPGDLKDGFDWNLLVKLGASSLSSELDLLKDEDGTHLLIHVKTEKTTVTKKLDELWGFQILRLFEIYVEENINLCSLCYEDENEKEAIFATKKAMFEKWNFRLEKFQS